MARIYNFEKNDWDKVADTITDEKHLAHYNEILNEFKRLYAITKTGNCHDNKVYDRLDDLQIFLDSYRKAYRGDYKTP